MTSFFIWLSKQKSIALFVAYDNCLVLPFIALNNWQSWAIFTYNLVLSISTDSDFGSKYNNAGLAGLGGPNKR